jgi:CRP-like cAMP-binding protein
MIQMPEIAHSDALSEIGILSALNSAEKRSIAPLCLWQNIQRNKQIIGHLERSDDVYFLVQGTVRAISYSVDGKEVSFRDIGPGEIFGEYAAIDGGERSANVFALTDIYVGSLSGRAFRDLLARYPTVSLAVMRLLTQQTRDLTKRIFEFSAFAVKYRIHAELLRLALASRPTGNVAIIENMPTHAELASRISTHREAITREFNALARLGLLEKRGRSTFVNDLTALQDMVRSFDFPSGISRLE